MSCQRHCVCLFWLFGCLLGCSLAMDLCGGAEDSEYTGSHIDSSGFYVKSDSVSHPYKFPKVRKCW